MSESQDKDDRVLEWAICREPQRSQLNRVGSGWIGGQLSAGEVALALWKLRVECVMHREAHPEPSTGPRRRWTDSAKASEPPRRLADVDLDLQTLAEAIVLYSGREGPDGAEERCTLLEDKCMFIRDKANGVDRAL
ncbi:hypothetical protein Pan44_10140 [Caulifigura coniformis]|uniref:Uncharacterized protein n=1 Tax=Caulifigura coniformis TaxID=2527983 RepID=A0A517SA40_9PLAN|nr:hypothetical protein Pan44_10140 [Caulifigura coniformis]